MNKLISKNISTLQVFWYLVTAVVTITVYALTTFATVQDVDKALNLHQVHESSLLQMVEKRLDRIENKLDQLISK
jgi:hypothetical protein